MSKPREERIKELKRQIADLQDEAEMVERWGDSVRSLGSFSDQAKVEAFNELYRRARTYLKDFVETGYEPKDAEHYLYEAVINSTLGSGAWDVINSLLR